MGWTVAVDESTEGRYLLAATFVRNGDVATVRRAVVTLTASLPGWRHMSRQSQAGKTRIVTLIAGADQHTYVYDAGGDGTSAGRKGQRGKRDRCLWALAGDIAQRQGDVRLVLDSHETEQRADEVTLYQAKKMHSLAGFRFDHIPEQGEPLVLIADAVAWCYGKGGLWPGRLGIAAERRDV